MNIAIGNVTTPLDHMLISGQTGSGKTILLTHLLGGVLKGKGQVIIIDPKHTGALKALDSQALESAQDIQACLDALLTAREIMDVRLALQTDAPPLVVCIDEFASIMRKGERKNVFEPVVLDLIEKGRAANVWVWMAAQTVHADVVTKAIKGNIGIVCAMKAGTQSASKAALLELSAHEGGHDAFGAHVRPGDCFVRIHGSRPERTHHDFVEPTKDKAAINAKRAATAHLLADWATSQVPDRIRIPVLAVVTADLELASSGLLTLRSTSFPLDVVGRLSALPFLSAVTRRGNTVEAVVVVDPPAALPPAAVKPAVRKVKTKPALTEPAKVVVDGFEFRDCFRVHADASGRISVEQYRFRTSVEMAGEPAGAAGYCWTELARDVLPGRVSKAAAVEWARPIAAAAANPPRH